MSTTESRPYVFPRVRRVRMHSFSLYSLRPDVSVAFDGGVLCLAGANGIGKSTFLATVNYGLTGAVPHPRRRLLSTQAYFKEATDYAGVYFNGRVAESDRDEAAVTIEFEIEGKSFKVTRGLFDPNDVRVFEVDGDSVLGGAAVTTLQRADLYRQHVTQAMGLTSFEQFVFLQHFVLTFDEARHLLFWDEAATSQSLFLCFGGDPQDAARADMLNREAERAGSRGRNAQFQVNNTRKRIDVIQQSLATVARVPDDIGDLDSEYQTLLDETTRTMEGAERLEAQMSEAEVRAAQYSAAVASLRAAYSEVFNRFLHGSSKPRTHPLVARVLQGVCGICDSSGPTVSEAVRVRLEANSCPFCGSPIKGTAGGDGSLKDELGAIDARLAMARAAFDDATAAQERLRGEVREAKARALHVREAVNRFESEHQDAADFLKGQQAARSGPVAQSLDGLRTAMAEFISARDLAYAERDRLRAELKTLQRELERRYAHAEQLFVPRFRQLAGLFLGIDLDVSLQLTMPAGMKLMLELRGNARREQDQLSESQRFFVDIALRMALAQQMSAAGGPATLFVDTPEGSLDIAYEDRAGEMFAQFAQSGHDMVMTANINSSKLLTTLASRCGSRHMSLNPMTGWTELSDVQQKATELFETAYNDIAAALKDGPSVGA
jgi:DNA repair exonuclease SbcCD ATPase subunit